MRWVVAALILALAPWPASAEQAGVADLSDFNLKTTEQLLDLCTADPSSEIYREAKQFCYGFFSGIYHFHDALAVGEKMPRIVCPEGERTREEAVGIFVAWARVHPDEVGKNLPAEAVIRAAVDKFGPCQK